MKQPKTIIKSGTNYLLKEKYGFGAPKCFIGDFRSFRAFTSTPNIDKAHIFSGDYLISTQVEWDKSYEAIVILCA